MFITKESVVGVWGLLMRISRASLKKSFFLYLNPFYFSMSTSGRGITQTIHPLLGKSAFTAPAPVSHMAHQ